MAGQPGDSSSHWNRPRLLTLAEIAAQLGGEVAGNPQQRVSGVNTLEQAGAADLAFLANPKYRKQLQTTQAGAVIVGPAERAATALPRIVADNPYLYFAQVVSLFHPEAPVIPGVHPTAVVEAGANIAASASIGALSFVGAGAQLGEAVVLGVGCSVGERVVIGECTKLHAHVTVYPDCQIGARAVIHSGAVIGADGFGLAKDGERWVKIPQVGRVVIGNDVEIGANTTIDRGALADTVLEDGVKLDNQIQVGHNVVIGAHTAIAGCVGIAGSARIGKRCTIGGSAGILGHLEICDDVHISAFSLVTKSINRPGTYTAVLPLMEHGQWLKSASRLRNLDQLTEQIRMLSQRLASLEQDKGTSKNSKF